MSQFMSTRPQTSFAKNPRRLQDQLGFYVSLLLRDKNSDADFKELQKSSYWSKVEDFLALCDEVGVDIGSGAISNALDYSRNKNVVEFFLAKSQPLTLHVALTQKPDVRLAQSNGVCDDKHLIEKWSKKCDKTARFLQTMDFPKHLEVLEDIQRLLASSATPTAKVDAIDVLRKSLTQKMVLGQSVGVLSIEDAPRRPHKM